MNTHNLRNVFERLILTHIWSLRKNDKTSGGFKWGARMHALPPPVQIILISCNFRPKKLQNNRLAHPLWELATPPPGKSWIRYWKHSLYLSWKECKNEILLIHTNVSVLLEWIFQHFISLVIRQLVKSGVWSLMDLNSKKNFNSFLFVNQINWGKRGEISKLFFTNVRKN